ncbi:hypothetical protein V7111_20210 [Neobacillus niacini]|uniref:hypothetical protein n=1 Tax=Neobacillus niacini TaxID=86668 RepID=UPI003001293C
MPELYIQTARDMGQLENSEGYKRCIVGNGLKEYNLTQLEYAVWKNVSRMSSVDQWREEMRSKIENKTRKRIEQIEEMFLAAKLMVPWNFRNIDDPELCNIYVTRNGFAFGAVKDKWVAALQDNSEKYTFSEEDYRIWVGATSTRLLVDVMEDLVDWYGYSEEQAFEAVVRKAKDFIRLGLWSAEYLDLEEEA